MFEDAAEPSPAESLSSSARAVLASAQDEATALNHHYVGTEHLLLALMGQPESRAAGILAQFADAESVRALVRRLVGVGETAPSDVIPMTPRLRQVLHFARREADLCQASKVFPEHLLIGILREGEGLAMEVLAALRVDFSRVIAEATTQAD